jgi:hypothetical protein
MMTMKADDIIRWGRPFGEGRRMFGVRGGDPAGVIRLLEVRR